MKTYAQKSSAVRAAKKAYGDDWTSTHEIQTVGEDGFIIVRLEPENFQPPAQLLSELKTLEFISEHENSLAIHAQNAKEIQSRKPVHIPVIHTHEAVAAIIPPVPTPPLPSFLQIASPAIPPVPKTQEEADHQANSTAVNIDPAHPRMSTIKLPTKKVWDIADKMPGAKRKEVIEACVAAGIAYGTARTQYQHWFKCQADMASTPIATIGADGKIKPPNKD